MTFVTFYQSQWRGFLDAKFTWSSFHLCRNEPPSGTLLWNSYCLSLQMVPSSPTVSTVGQRENMQKHHTWPPLDDWGDYRGWGATKPLIHLDPNLKQLIFFDGMGGSWDDVMMVGLSKPFPPENQRIFQIWWHYITLLFLQQEPDEFCWSHFFLKFSNIFAVIRSDSRWSPGMNVLPGVYLEAFPWSLGAVWIILAHAKRI